MVEGTYALQGKERSNALLGERREIFDLGWGMASKLLGCCLLSRCESDLRALSNDSSFTRGSKKKKKKRKRVKIYIYIYNVLYHRADHIIERITFPHPTTPRL